MGFFETSIVADVLAGGNTSCGLEHILLLIVVGIIYENDYSKSKGDLFQFC